MSTDPQASWVAKLTRWLDGLRQSESQLAMVLSLVIGALVGLVVVAFILLTSRLGDHLHPATGPGWQRILIPTLGALITGYLLYRYFPAARGSGIPQTKAAVYIHDGRISFRTVFGKFFCCSASLASGIALGREGPSVQIGAGLASVIGRRLRMRPAQVKALIPVGSAAALAAAFNTPIAAVLFSLEEIMGDLHAPILGSVVLSSATSWMVLHLLLGDEPLFHVTAYHLVSTAEFLVYAMLGVVGGLGSVCFVKLLLALRRRFLDLPKRTTWFQPVAGGLTVGLMGYFMPQVMGVGYGQVELALAGSLTLKVVVLLAVLKLIATATCYASGNAGGIFAPSLFIGSMLGAAVGSLAHLALPQYTAGAGAYALVGMGTVFAGTVRTPLTSVIMIFEVTRDYSIIVPLMISNLIAFFISHRLQPEPIYEALARQDGIHLPTSAFRDQRLQNQVSAAMRAPDVMLSPPTAVREALEQTRHSTLDAWPVADGDGFRGMIARAALEDAIANGGGEQAVVHLLVDDLARHRPGEGRLPHVHPDHPLSLTLERMGVTGLGVLPVVSRANVRELIAVVTLHDVLVNYGLQRALASKLGP